MCSSYCYSLLLLLFCWVVPTSQAFFLSQRRSSNYSVHPHRRSNSQLYDEDATRTSSTRLFHNNKKTTKRNSNGNSAGGGFASFRGSPDVTFPYTGTVRPGNQSPQRIVVQEDIVKPDYWQTRIPTSGKPLLPWMIEVKTASQIVKMREAGRLARHVLDMAGRMVEPGITTDEIDGAVHAEIVKVTRIGKNAVYECTAPIF